MINKTSQWSLLCKFHNYLMCPWKNGERNFNWHQRIESINSNIRKESGIKTKAAVFIQLSVSA